MKTILTTFLTLAITNLAFAQNPDKALARVSYNFSHIQDTTQKDKPYTELMLLLVGKNASFYTSYDKINQTIIKNKMLEGQKTNQIGGFANNSSSKAPSNIDYFYFFKENKFFIKERIFNYYLVDEIITKINWKITKDTTSFSGINCQKATAYFKGRNWVAWFAPELPFESGPWKLNGLPGLIIEAYDDSKTILFQFAGLEKVTSPEENSKNRESKTPTILNNKEFSSIFTISGTENITLYLNNEIKLPSDAIKTTRKEIDILKKNL